MTIQSFLTRIQYSKERPEQISMARWLGMLIWFNTHKDEIEELVSIR